MIKQFITILTLLAMSITAMAQDDTDDNQQIIHISPYQQECTGVGLQNCLVVRYDDEDDLSFFYDSISGFLYEEGFEYTLLVNITERENPPADASSLEYELVEVVQKLPAQIDGDRMWELQSLNGTEVDDPTRYTLTVTEDGIGLLADCNSVLADFTLQPLSIETTISTQALCPEDSLDRDYLDAINQVTLISIENGELILQSSEGQLRFAPPAIDGTEWTMIDAVNPAMETELDDSIPYTLSIEDDSAHMTLACNSANADVELEGAVIRFGAVASTRAFCINEPLAGLFPPTDAVYYVTQDGNLILEDAESNRYEFTAE